MEKKRCTLMLAAILMSAAGAVGASQPDAVITLSDSEMDRVSAGAQASFASGAASAWFGSARSWSQSSSFSSAPLTMTSASSMSVAIGVQTTATATANSTF